MFSITKFLGGFAFWKGAIIGKLVYYAIIIAICIGAYHVLFIKRTEVQNQKADVIQNIQVQEKNNTAFFGLRIYGIKLGLEIE